MANFSNDADLLAYEPNVFVDLPFAGQRPLRVTDAAVSGMTVTSATGGFNDLAAGDVAVVWSSESDKTTHAVASVSDDNTLTLATAPVGLAATSGLSFEVRTFEPQAAEVHDELLRALGIDTDDEEAELDESSVLSVGLMRRLEVLGTLAGVYMAAPALVGDNRTVDAKAERYGQRFVRAMGGARVLIDVDGDGRADVWRSPGVGNLQRV